MGSRRPASSYSGTAAAWGLEGGNARNKRRMEKQKKETPPPGPRGGAVGGGFAKQERAKRDKAAWEKRRKMWRPSRPRRPRRGPGERDLTRLPACEGQARMDGK